MSRNDIIASVLGHSTPAAEMLSEDWEEIKRLRAELAELRKPDCFRCAYWFACRTLIKDDCGGGDKFVPKRGPVRLYERG